MTKFMDMVTSKRWSAYVLTLAALVGLAVVKADPGALENISLAILLGQPTLLGGESAVRVAQTRKARTVTT